MNFRNLLIASAIAISSTIAHAAPFWPNFHNVPANTFFNEFSYYPNQGMGLQTISLYRSGNQTLSAGSFSHHVNGAWYARGNMTTAGFNNWFNQYGQEGFRPREISVMTTAQGEARFTAIWKKLSNEAYYTYINMNPGDFHSKWQNIVENQGFRVEDHAAYMVNGQLRHAAIYVKDSKPFYFYHSMTQAGFEQRFHELSAQGFYPSTLNAVSTPQGIRYSAVWLKKPGQQIAVYINMSADGYQARFDQFNAQGYRLQKLQGYANGTRFAAIWVK